MKSFIILILICLYNISNLDIHAQNQQFVAGGGNNGEQKSISLMIGEGDANFTGDLNLNLPILTIPGRNGLDYTVKLTYSSVIRVKQPASWVGLGFNLTGGNITRSVVHRVDEQLIDMFITGPYNLPSQNSISYPGRFDCIDEQKGILWGHESDDESWDTYYLNLGDYSSRIVPIPYEEMTYPIYNVGTVKFFTHNKSPIKIDYNIHSTGTPLMDDEVTMQNFIPNFRAIKEDGTKYFFDKKTNIYFSGFSGPNHNQTLNYQYPTGWELSAIQSNDYVDVGNNGIGDEDLGSWIKFTYSTVTNLSAPSWDNVALGYNIYPNTNISYDYNYISSIETPTHIAVFGLGTKSDGRKYLSVIELKRKNPNGESVLIKKISFIYGTELNQGNYWEKGYALRGNQFALQSIVNNYTDDSFYSENDTLFTFSYKYNPDYVYNPQDQSEFYGPLNGDFPWVLHKMKNQTGAEITYEFERDTYNWYTNTFDFGSTFMSTFYTATPINMSSSRIKQVTLDDKINAPSIWSFSYGEGVKQNPPWNSMSQIHFNEMSRYLGNIGYRSVECYIPDHGSIKKYFTSGVDVEGSRCIYLDGNPVPPVENSKENFPSVGDYYSDYKDNSPRHGIIWKQDYFNSGIKVKSENFSYQFYDYINNTNRPDGLYRLYPTWANNNEIITTQDGIDKRVWIVNNSYTSKPSLTGIWFRESNIKLLKSKRIESLDMVPMNMLQEYFYGVHEGNYEASDTYRYVNRTDWETTWFSQYGWYKRIYPKKEYRWRETHPATSYLGSTDPDEILFKEKEFDDYGNLIVEKDANQSYKQYTYEYKGSKLSSIISNLNNLNVPSSIENFNDNNISDNDPLNWQFSGMQPNNDQLVSSGTGYAGLPTLYSNLYTVEVQLKITNDYGDNSNWAGIHLGSTSMSDINTGLLILYRNNGNISLYSNKNIIQSVNTNVIPNLWRRLKVNAEGNFIKVFLDGSQIFNYNYTNNLPTGYISINTYNTDTRFDNFRVYALNAIVNSFAYDCYTLDLKEEINQDLISTIYHYDKWHQLTKKFKRVDGKDVLVSELRYHNSPKYNEGNFNISDPNSLEEILYNNSLHFSDFSDASGWSSTSMVNTVFNTDFDGEKTVKMGATSGWVTLTKPGEPSHQLLRVDFYADLDLQTDPIPIAFGSSNYRFAVQYVSSEAKFRMQLYTNGTWSYPLWFTPYIHKGKWYTIELEKNTSGEVWAYVFPKGECRTNKTGFKYYTSGFPYNWNANIYSYSNGNYYYLANFYCGLPRKTIKYFDANGKEIQRINQNMDNSIVEMSSYYNSLGNITKSVKPYEKKYLGLDKLKFVLPSIDILDSDNYYNTMDQSWTSSTSGFPYEETKYNTDPLNRISRISYPGLNWRMDVGHNKSISYSCNTQPDEIRPTYFQNELFKQQNTDEQGNVINSYFDQHSNNLISKVLNTSGSSIETDYYYDVLNNLVKVVDPELKENTYTYNTLNDLIQKNTPDNGTTKYLYDKMSNLRFVQDANHSGSKNNVNINNGSGTILPNITGTLTLNLPANVYLKAQIVGTPAGRYIRIKIKTGTTYLATIEANSINALVTQYVYLPKGSYTYEISSYNSGTFIYQIQNQSGYEFVYNKYDNDGRLSETGECDFTNSYSSFTQSNADLIAFPTSNTLVSKKYVYDTQQITGQRNLIGKVAKSESYRFGILAFTTYYSYNDLGLVEWKMETWASGYSIRQNFFYDNVGKIVKKELIESSSRNIYTFYEYDQPGRLVKVYTDTNPNGTTKVQEAEYQYFANGSVKRLQLANAQGLDYRYNSRDWLTMINHQNLNSTQDPGQDGAPGSPTTVDKFGMILGYNDVGHIGSAQNTTAQHNGNISWLMYNMSTAAFNGFPLVGYSFAYDNANRLVGSNFGYYNNAWLPSNAFDENNITYDKAGNFLTLNRYNGSGTIMDQFGYNYYTGTNKLKYVTDAAGSSVSTTDIDNQITTNYLYDGNGNVYQDYGNNVRFVINDINNLPLKIFKADGSVLEYTYDVNGQRVLNTSSNKYYVNGLSGSNEAIVDRTDNSKITHNLYGLDLIGQIDRVNTTLTRYYYLKDHLGSIRVRVNSLGAVSGYDDYYPFGSISRSSATGLDVRYKFTGKERDLATSYDYFGARFYESRLGRWLQVDPMADIFAGTSPYNYCFNNPLIFIDPDGKDTIYYANYPQPVVVKPEKPWFINAIFLANDITTKNTQSFLKGLRKEYDIISKSYDGLGQAPDFTKEIEKATKISKKLTKYARGIFYIQTLWNGVDLYNNYSPEAFHKYLLDTGMSAAMTFGGPIGFFIGGTYFIIDGTVGWEYNINSTNKFEVEYEYISR